VGHPEGWVMHTWQSPYEIIGDGCDNLQTAFQVRHTYYYLLCFCVFVFLHSNVLLTLVLFSEALANNEEASEAIASGAADSFFGYESISTVDFDRFLGEIDGRSNIDRILK